MRKDQSDIQKPATALPLVGWLIDGKQDHAALGRVVKTLPTCAVVNMVDRNHLGSTVRLDRCRLSHFELEPEEEVQR